MTGHRTGTREEWLEARTALLADEKAHTRAADDLARRRQELPWVRLDKDYAFDREDGSRATLRDLFDGRSQLLVYHFMFPGCESCASLVDGLDGSVVHLQNHDVAVVAVSRSPIDELVAFTKRLGWRVPFASSSPSDFNTDFAVSFTDDEIRDGIEYNFTKLPPAEPGEMMSEAPGISAFAIQDDAVHHTYSAYARGGDALWGMYAWLDRAPLGRNEPSMDWFKIRDEY